jgi:hypothetical protein
VRCETRLPLQEDGGGSLVGAWAFWVIGLGLSLLARGGSEAADAS